jgi:hypothetical protein
VLRKTEGHNPREKLRRLSGFAISEYSNESIIASLRSQASRALQSGRRDPYVVQRELLGAVRAFYSPEHRSPPGVFKVLCADAVWRDAREVHLSESYGQAGSINAALYRTLPHLLLADSEANGLETTASDAAFFEWIGANRWPRAEKVPLPINLRDVIRHVITETVTVDDGTYRQTFGKNDISWGYNFDVTCSMIVGLEDILKTAESDAILAWLGSDPRFDLAARIISQPRVGAAETAKRIFGLIPARFQTWSDSGSRARHGAHADATRWRRLEMQ